VSLKTPVPVDRKHVILTKIDALTTHIHEQTSFILTKLSTKELNKKESSRIIELARISKLLQQLGNLSLDLETIINKSKDNNADFSDDSKIGLDECISKLADNLILLKNNFPNFNNNLIKQMQVNEDILRSMITKNYKKYLERLVKGNSTSGSLFADTLGIIQDSELKIREIRKIMT